MQPEQAPGSDTMLRSHGIPEVQVGAVRTLLLKS